MVKKVKIVKYNEWERDIVDLENGNIMAKCISRKQAHDIVRKNNWKLIPEKPNGGKDNERQETCFSY